MSDPALISAGATGTAQAGVPRTLIELRGVSKTFGSGRGGAGAAGPVLADIDLAVRESEFVALVGPSGCGKSTVLNLVAGLHRPTKGTVTYQSGPVPIPNTGIGYMTQHDTLLPWRTVEQNLRIPLQLRHRPRAAREEEVGRVLDLVGLTGFARHFPAQLSGGMRQRASLARVLLYSPEVILLDEPFGALDAITKLALQREFAAIWQELRKTVILVTHDLVEAIALSDRVVVFGAHPGRIIGQVEVGLDRPRDILEIQGSPGFVDIYRELAEMLGIRKRTSA